jgi:hypothetical protein
MKLQLNVGDWATLAFFALGMALGCYAEAERALPARAPASTTTANPSNSARTAVAAVGLERGSLDATQNAACAARMTSPRLFSFWNTNFDQEACSLALSPRRK